MAAWLDLALLGDEATLTKAIQDLDGDGQGDALHSLAEAMGLSEMDITAGLIRVLVERVRPLALPATLWSRPIDSSEDPRPQIKSYFAKKGIPATRERMRAAYDLYVRFASERRDNVVKADDLRRCGFRCVHCGLAFCNEQLQDKVITSPFGNRGRDKLDALKPHWNAAEKMRKPTHDHEWPIATYGDNGQANLRVLCHGCNHGKENILALEQVKAWTGLVPRRAFVEPAPLDWTIFYAQLRHSPQCCLTGRTAADTELTVRLIDPEVAAVLGNLETIESRGI
ncbi:hypothetical protein [Sphingomonas kyeonggiensis]|uniref:5-methylcytosine-specific restriction endonuclease McrA n=1 Tax=Sphingomonas kyeonggiensis TaxID=1268553 RepID=A0A7W6JVT5_9SPHN|nr:hypothetical protein [Sphingomonas kyeonggiensis]MBB4100482.1 5-methylcytosine-specific restriction endonuclease McrA [Sphingomonas kyeonggiensis]